MDQPVDDESNTRQRRRFIPGIIPALPIVLVTLMFILPAAAPSLIAPHGALSSDLNNTYAPPAWDGGTWSHLLGTDALGRDVLSRIIYGARESALMALFAVGASALIGTIAGMMAGYYGGVINAVVMRTADVFFSLPFVLLAIALATLVGASFTVALSVMILVSWGQFARLVRGEVLGIREREFVKYARIVGVADLTILWRHIFPNVRNSLLVMVTLQVGWVILAEAGLSFLGAGIPPPAPAWGSMVADGRTVVQRAWWISLFPGLAIVLVILSLNLLGDWLRDRLDPRMRPVLE